MEAIKMININDVVLDEEGWGIIKTQFELMGLKPCPVSDENLGGRKTLGRYADSMGQKVVTVSGDLKTQRYSFQIKSCTLPRYNEKMRTVIENAAMGVRG